MISFAEFLKSLPAIMSVFMELRKMWLEYIKVSDRNAKMIELRAALKEAREKKDTTSVEKVIRSIVSGS